MSRAPTRNQPPAPTAAPRAPRTLPAAREALVAAIRRDTPGSDLPRYVAILDDLLAWTASRSARLVFRTDATAGDSVSFGRDGTKVVFWSVRPTRGNAPTLEIAPPAGGSLTPAGRARATATLNAHSRAVLADGDRLRIGFGALKNAAARAAVLALLDDLLTDGDAPPPDAADPAPGTAPGMAADAHALTANGAAATAVADDTAAGDPPAADDDDPAGEP